MYSLGSHGKRRLLSIYRFRGLLQFHYYSTSSAATASPLSQTHFVADYLINSLGFSTEEAITASNKVIHLKSTKNPELVLNFFTQCGLDKTQIRNIVFSAPKLLLSNVDKTLKPKFRLLQDLGLSGLDLVKVISCDSQFFNRGLDTYLVPSIDYLKKVLGSSEKVVRAINKEVRLLSTKVHHIMPPNVVVLQKSGFSNEKIEKFIVKNPRYAMQKPEWLQDKMHRVEEELGIHRSSGMFFHGITVLASISKSTKEMKFGIFRSFGWSNSDILTMARNMPGCLTLSEAKIHKLLNFFMNELGYAPGYLASHPRLLTFSLEKRVVPRNEVLKILEEKKLLMEGKPNLFSVLCYSELRYRDYFLQRYKNEIPSLYEIYINKMEL